LSLPESSRIVRAIATSPTVEPDDALDLAASRDVVGHLCPVLRADDGQILDGRRLLVDPNWLKRVIHTKDARKKLLTRIHANFQRRTVSKEQKEEVAVYA
jgi:hypothetical protein